MGLRGNGPWAVAGRTFLRRRLVEQDSLAFHHSACFVAGHATHIAVGSLQRKRRSFIVIEQRWLPLSAVVTFRTWRDPALCKLLSVNVFVALFAFVRRGLEVHVQQAGLHIRGLVAIDACGRGCAPTSGNEVLA